MTDGKGMTLYIWDKDAVGVSSCYDQCANAWPPLLVPAGTAVSGEITLHGDHLYVQVSQSALGSHSGILFRTCKGRKDYVGEV